MTGELLRFDAAAAAGTATVVTMGLTAITALAGPISEAPDNPRAARAGLTLATGVTVLAALLAFRQTGSLIPAVVGLAVAGTIAATYNVAQRQDADA